MASRTRGARTSPTWWRWPDSSAQPAMPGPEAWPNVAFGRRGNPPDLLAVAALVSDHGLTGPVVPQGEPGRGGNRRGRSEEGRPNHRRDACEAVRRPAQEVRLGEEHPGSFRGVRPI